MKLVMLGDIHFGARSNNPVIFKHQVKFFTQVLLPYMETHQLNVLISPGDLFEHRKTSNNLIINDTKTQVFDLLKRKNITFHVSLGNHDLFYKESVSVNTPHILLQEYDNIIIYESPTQVLFDTVPFDFIPWICEENRKEIAEFVNNSTSDYCFGHFEFDSFEMYKGIPSHGGMSIENYKRYKEVFSGHYHTKSKRNNIRYLGTPYDTNWSEYADIKGFYILDTETGDIEFIQNPYTIFDIIHYDDSITDYAQVNVSDYTEKYIKVIVLNKTNYYMYDQFINRLYNAKCVDIKIIEDLTEYNNGIIDEKIDLADTKEILNNYVDSLESDLNKEKIKALLNQLYIESINLSIN